MHIQLFRVFALFVLLSASCAGPALAQAIFNVGSTAATAADIGYAEPAGSIRLSVYSGTTIAAPLVIKYSAPIANNSETEIAITGTGNLSGIAPAPSLNRADNSITIHIPAGGTFGDQIGISGVRIQIAGLPFARVTASLTDPGGNSNSIWAGQRNPVVIDAVMEPFSATPGSPLLYGYGQSENASSSIEVSENYTTAFSDSVGTGGQTLPARIRLRPFPDLPTGARITFSATATASTGALFRTLSGEPETVPREDGSSDVVFEFVSASNSPAVIESFRFNVSFATIPMTEPGVTYLQAMLIPTGAESREIPRYAERLVPDETELSTGQSTLVFPFRIKPENTFTGVALTNPDDYRVKTTLTAYGADGTPLSGIENPVSIVLGPNGQFAKTAAEIFGNSFNALSAGIIRVVAHSPHVKGFYVIGDISGPKLDGGNSNVEGLATSYLPGIFREGNNPFNLLEAYNPGDSEVQVTFDLLDAAGTIVATGNEMVPPGGLMLRDAKDIFGTILNSFEGGYIKTHSPSPVVLRNNFGNELESNVLGAQLQSSEMKIHVPHFASGGLYSTELNLANSNQQITSYLHLTLLDNDGNPLEIESNPATLQLNPGTQVTRTIAGLFPDLGANLVSGSLRIEIGPRNPFMTGPGVVGAIRYHAIDGSASAVLPIVPDLTTDCVYSQVAEGSGYYTGVAIQNPNDRATTFVLDVYAKDGALVGTYEKTLQPYARISAMISQLVPAAAGQTGGYFRIRSNAPISSFALFGTTDIHSLSVIAPQILH